MHDMRWAVALSLTLWCLSGQLARAAGPLPPNLWPNPGFEEGFKWGQERADCRVDTTQAHSGKQCLRLSIVPGTTETWPTRTNYRNLAGASHSLETNQTYLLRLWAKLRCSPEGNNFLVTGERQKGKLEYVSPRPAAAVSQDWTQYEWLVRTPESDPEVTQAQVIFWFCLAGRPGGEVWIDDLELYQVPVCYQSAFEIKDAAEEAPEGWTPSGPGATWAEREGAVGPRSLALSLTKDGQPSPSWESGFLPVTETDLRLSCRMRGVFSFSPDPTYNASLTVEGYDAQRRLLRTYPDFLSLWRGYVGTFDNALAVSTADQWNYLSHGEKFPEGTAFLKLRFCFRHGALTDATRGQAWLDDLTLARNLYDDPPVGPSRWPVWDNENLRIYTPVFMNVFLETEPLQFEVLIVNTPEQLAQNPRARLEYEVYDVYHTVVEHKSLPLKDLQPLPAETFAAKSPWKRTYERATRKTIILSPDLSTQVGRFFYFDARVTEGQKIISQGCTNFLIISPASPVSAARAEQSKFMTGFLYDEKTTKWDPFYPMPHPWGQPRPTLRQALGLHWVHASPILAWGSAQPTPGAPIAWDKEWYDELEVRSGLVKPGVNNFTYVAFWNMLERSVPSWVKVDPKNAVQPYDPEIYGQWVYDVVSHYQDYNQVWAVGFSEAPLTGDEAEKHFRWARAGYQAAKRADPDAIVFGIGFTGVTLERIDAYLARGNLDYTDALDVHLYGSVISEEQCLDYLQSEMKRRGKIRPIWSTEMGSWHRDQDALCQDMVKKHVTAFACGVHRAEWHAFGTPEWNREASMWRYYWGFREPWLSSALPAAEVQPRYFVPFEKVGTYYNLVRHLDYVQPRNRFTYGEDVRVYAFDRDGERVYGVWQLPSATGTGRSLALNTTWPVTVTDAYGRRVELDPGPYGRVAFPVSLRPRLVSIQGQPGQPCGDAFDPAHFGNNRDDLVFRPGPFQVDYTAHGGDEPVTLTVQVTNTFAQDFRGKLQVELDDTWHLEPTQTRVNLSPGKSLTTRFTLRPETEKAPGTYAVKLLLRDDEGILPAFSEVHFTLGQ